MVKTDRGNKTPSEWKLYKRPLRTPQETRRIGKRSETVEFQNSKKNVIFIDKEESHMLCLSFLKSKNFLSFCSNNKFEYLTQYNVNPEDNFKNVKLTDQKELKVHKNNNIFNDDLIMMVRNCL